MTDAVRADGLSFSWEGKSGFSGVTFSVPPGGIACIFGRNGSGKSTLLTVLSTLAAPQEGTFRVLGIDAVKDPPGARKRLFPVFDRNAHFDQCTGRENIGLFLSLYGRECPAMLDEAAQGFDLDLDKTAGTCSLGMRRKLLLLEAFLSERPVLLFDEPALGLDSASRDHFFSLARDAARDGRSVIFSTNRIEDTRHATSLFLMDGGTLAPASPGELEKGLLKVTWSLAGGDETEYLASADDLPDRLRSLLAREVPRRIEIGGTGEKFWTPEAEERIRRAPAPLRPMIRTLVERHTKERGYTRITPDVIDEVRGRFGHP